ncbi:MAG: double-strand break repair protein AddB [Brevundimonas sp.]|uniref:double-strand break repair protein AddB n=1 Tax=Brevundimonas sp. TaxID=1871086 RepID=UPI00391BCF10
MTSFDPFAGSGPRWFTIAAQRPFLEDLASGVLAWLGEASPEVLSDAIILLPNRRAARAFSTALARAAGARPVLLPEVRPLGDLEEDEPPFAPGALGLDLPPAIAPLRRRFEMARMIVERFDADLTPLRALELADALGGFLDSCQLEEIVEPARVAHLVKGEMARHWERSAQFLSLAVEAWPERLKALGLVDPAWRRATLLRRLAETWDAEPPARPVIAAGSTGTLPSAADVLGAVARAPQGCVVVPGLDQALDEAAWSKIEEAHPQAALKRLLERHGVERAAVRPWLSSEVETARSRVIQEALRPAEATDDWRGAIRDLRARVWADRSADPIAEGLKGLSLLTVRAEEEAASAIALMMREALETPGRTCALVTPDLDLSRRVEARLERWGITADSSAGAPLALTEAGGLVQLAARWMADPLSPQTLLALLKHARRRPELSTEIAARTLEGKGLRGPRPRDWTALLRKLEQAGQPRDGQAAPSPERLARLSEARSLAETLQGLVEAARAPFAGGRAPLDKAATALTELIEALAGPAAWAGRDGEAAAGLMSALIEQGEALGGVTPDELAALVAELIAAETVRTGGASHPRLRILGAIEARLARADLMILAGLEEGVWPRPAPTDPFLSRPMRKALDLPAPERRLGQTAQDFVQAACAPEAVMVVRERRGGQPAVRSRWLWRLEMLVSGAHGETTPVTIAAPDAVLSLTRALDAPARATPDYARRPEPRPPVHRRPRNLPVTSIERWVRDPYAIYASRVLGLKKLDRPGASAEAMARGTAIHAALETVVRTWPDALPEDCAEQIEAWLIHEIDAAGFEDHAMARERPLAANCARWLEGFERARRARGAQLLVEQSGALTFNAPGGPFTVTAKADRIELDATGAAVIDFKTGSAPQAKQVAAGFAPQLTLAAAILAEGGFPAPPTEATELLYVQLTGRREPGKVTDVGAEGAAFMAERELARLKAGVALFDDEAMPYRSWVAPQFMGTFGGNFDHLARVWEWHVAGAEEEGAQ